MKFDDMRRAYDQCRMLASRLSCIVLLLAAGSLTPLQAQTPPAQAGTTAPAARSTPLSARDIARSALLASGAGARRGAWQFKGTANLHGAQGTFEMVFDSRFRFLWKTTGALAEVNLFDGSSCWVDGPVASYLFVRPSVNGQDLGRFSTDEGRRLCQPVSHGQYRHGTARPFSSAARLSARADRLHAAIKMIMVSTGSHALN